MYYFCVVRKHCKRSVGWLVSKFGKRNPYMLEHRTSPSMAHAPCPTYNSRPRRHVDEPPSSWVSWCAEKGPKDAMQKCKTFELYELGSKSTLDFSTRGNTSLIEVVPEFFLKFFKTAVWFSATPKMPPWYSLQVPQGLCCAHKGKMRSRNT